MGVCRLCNQDRQLVLHDPHYGILANKSERKVKICRTCSILLDEYSTKKYTSVLQSELWDKPVQNPIDATIRPMRRVNYMLRFCGEVTGNPESLGEHIHYVTMMSMQIRQWLIDEHNTHTDFERVVTMAMFHDDPEILCGDLPTPIKIGRLKADNDRLEAMALDIFKNKWGIYTGAVDEYDYSDKDNTAARIVKCADYMSAAVYCIEECYIGGTLDDALQNTMTKFRRFVHHDWEKELFDMIYDYAEVCGVW